MFNNLLLVSLISLGAGAIAPAPLNNKSVLANNDQTTQFDLEINNITSVTESHTYNNATLKSTKNQYSQYNNALLVNGTTYIQNIDEYLNPYWFNIRQEQSFNTMLYVVEITPYRYLYSSNIEIGLFLSISDIVTTTTNDRLKVNIDTISTIYNWSSYLNIANYYRNGNNKEIWDDVTSTHNGYSYNQYHQEETFNLSDTTNWYQNQYYNIPITLVNEHTNYIFIYINSHYYGNEDPNYDEDLELNNYIGMDDSNNYIRIHGLMIPPVSNYEIIDIPGTMFYILTMPFTFISTAFNLTLFPGTLYQFNIGNIFLTIIGILSFMFLIRIFTRNR